ncbi:MAG: hypothetical protein LBO09_03520 [Candidatus Peribacteria bacterium]|nr:hypothetical protein [Candidatus Peribacteria bacterium]
MEEKDILEEEISPEENIVEKAEILDIYMEDSLKEEDLLPMATLNSGSLTLKITEVYPWSANERIEITNFGEEAFSGILTIKTNAGNSNTSTGMVELAAHTSLLIVNMTITGIHTEDIIIINASKDFTITDTKEAVIQIFYEEKFLDKFEVSLSDMTTSANKNKNKSFERYFNTASGTIQATTSDHLSHNLTGFSINP